MLRYSVLIIVMLFFTACGGSDEKKAGTDTPIDNTIKFEIGSTQWSLELPEGWKTLESRNPDSVLSAEKHTQNFFIRRHEGKGGNILDYFTQTAQKDFYYFEPIEKVESTIKFKAQTRASTPLRIYHQKFFEIPETTFYLLGSCSHETAIAEDDCLSILKEWNTIKQKKK